MRRRLTVVSLLAWSLSFAPTGTAQMSAPPSIEGRWTVTTRQMTNTFPGDLVVSVDRDRIYGMLGDYQIRGTFAEGRFSFETPSPRRLVLSGTIQTDGTIAGDAIIKAQEPLVGMDGTVITGKQTSFTGRRTFSTMR